MSKYITGSYESVVGQDAADFFQKIGMTADVAKQFIGKNMKMCTKVVSDKTFLVANEIEGMPEWNMTLMLREGVEVSYNMPGFGLLKGCIKICGADCLEYTEKTETMGTLVYNMTFCDKGVEYVIKSVDHGCSYTVNWQRVVDSNGTWRLHGQVEGDDFPCLLADIDLKTTLEDPTYKFHLTECKDGFISKDYCGGNIIVTKGKWGEEAQSTFDKDVTDLYVKTGPGSTKSISKHKDGRIQEHTMTQCMDKMKLVSKDLKTGKIMTATFEKFTDFSGEYKIISCTGLPEMAKAVGANVEDCMGTFNGPSTIYCLKDVGCLFEMGIKVEGKTVHKTSSSYGEEVSTCFPHMGKESFQVVTTKQGCTITIIAKGPAYTIKTTMKRTKSFLIMTDEIIGTCIKSTFIAVPTCC